MSLPRELETAMQETIELLAGHLTVTEDESATHKVVTVTGWEASEEILQAIARYLVGIRACAIDAALHIKAQLADTEEDRVEVLQNVIQIVGKEEGQLSEDQIRTERNPWIAEGIWHLCLASARENNAIHPLGNILAANYLHVQAKEPGLDVSAIYLSEGTCGLALIESKAYEKRPNAAISEAVRFFRSVDSDEHALQIRQAVQIMRSALDAETQPLITLSFWRREREYIPNPHYVSSEEIDWTIARPSFRSLAIDKDHIVIMPNAIDDYGEFFDAIASEMRRFASEL